MYRRRWFWHLFFDHSNDDREPHFATQIPETMKGAKLSSIWLDECRQRVVIYVAYADIGWQIGTFGWNINWCVMQFKLVRVFFTNDIKVKWLFLITSFKKYKSLTARCHYTILRAFCTQLIVHSQIRVCACDTAIRHYTSLSWPATHIKFTPNNIYINNYIHMTLFLSGSSE